MANSFTMLMDDYENKHNKDNRFTLPDPNGLSDCDRIEQRLLQQQQTRRFNGDVADLFLPRMIRAVIGIFGGDVASDNDSFDRPPPSDGLEKNVAKPGGPGSR